MIELKEYCGYTFHVNPCSTTKITKLTEDNNLIVPNDTLLVDIEGIHSYPFATRNFTRYTKECLKNSTPFWTKPYNRPLIKHHNETDGTIIGRILNAEYQERSSLYPDAACLLFTAMIPREESASDVKTGLLSTVSIGVIAHDIRCSICGQNIAEEGLCEHDRGQVYDNEICYWDVYNMEPKELSYVIVPSDSYAKNVKVYSSTPPLKRAVNESLHNKTIYSLGGTMDEKEKQALLDQIESLQTELTESKTKQSELEASLQESQKTVKEQEAQLTEKETALQEAATKEETAQAKITELQTSVTELAEKQKAAETQAIEIRESYRKVLTQNLNFARKVSGRQELSESVLNERSDASLQDSYNDLISEIKESFERKIPEPVKNPTLPNLNEGANQGQHKEGKLEERKPIDLKKALEDVFSAAARS